MKKILLLVAFIGVAAANDPPSGTLSVDTGNSKAANLVFLTYPGNVNQNEIVSGSVCTKTGSTVWNSSGDSGTAAQVTGDGNVQCPVPAAMVSAASSHSWTFLIRAKFTTLGSAWARYFALPHTAPNPPFYVWGLVNNGSSTADDVATFITDDTGGQQFTLGTTGFWQTGAFHDFALVIDSAASTYRYYVDGVDVHDEGQFGYGLDGFDGMNPISILDVGIQGQVNFAAVWSRAVSGSELTSLLDPAEKNALVTSSGGGSMSSAARRRQNIQ